MSIYGPNAGCEVDQEDDLSDYAKTNYVDVQVGLRVLKAGDTMSGDLAMGGNLVRGLPTTYPPLYHGDEAASWDQVVGITRDALNTAVKLDGTDPMTGDLDMGNHQIKGVNNPVNSQDAATKNYVDSHKHVITVWAEENRSIDRQQYEWSFGNSAAGIAHANCGYTLMAAGRILRMGLAATTNSGAPGASKVNIVVNGTEQTLYGVTKPSGQYSGTTTFKTPLELSLGDRVNFRSVTTNGSVTSAIVSLLIELDL